MGGAWQRWLSQEAVRSTESVRENKLELELGSKLSKPFPSDELPSVRLHHLHKQHHPLGTKCSKAPAYGGHSNLATTVPFLQQIGNGIILAVH